jgi:hypothetical protein
MLQVGAAEGGEEEEEVLWYRRFLFSWQVLSRRIFAPFTNWFAQIGFESNGHSLD